MESPRFPVGHEHNFSKVIRVPPEAGKQLRTPLVNQHDGLPCRRRHVGFHGYGRACHRFDWEILWCGGYAEEINALDGEEFLPRPHIMACLVIEPEDEGSWRCRQILGNAERATGECGAEEGRDRIHAYMFLRYCPPTS